MQLRCVGRYRSAAGSYDLGVLIDCTDETGAFLLRDSPSSFVRVDAGGAPAPAPSDTSAALGAMSTTTATGLTVPDRRARGGRIRRGE
jgi:hypothetical protein